MILDLEQRLERGFVDRKAQFGQFVWVTIARLFEKFFEIVDGIAGSLMPDGASYLRTIFCEGILEGRFSGLHQDRCTEGSGEGLGEVSVDANLSPEMTQKGREVGPKDVPCACGPKADEETCERAGSAANPNGQSHQVQFQEGRKRFGVL